MICRREPIGRSVIPIEPKCLQFAVLSRDLLQGVDQWLVRAIELGSPLGPAYDKPAARQEIAGVDEYGALIRHEKKRARKSGPNRPPT
jgi:hypothetical protein